MNTLARWSMPFLWMVLLASAVAVVWSTHETRSLFIQLQGLNSERDKLDIAWGNSISAVVIFSQSPDAAQFVGQSFINANVTVVAEKSAIKSPKDIVGKKVVVSGPKTASTLFFQIGLKKAGVDPAKNEYFVSGTGPQPVESLAAEVLA